jgi:hypothetical protein
MGNFVWIGEMVYHQLTYAKQFFLSSQIGDLLTSFCAQFEAGT